MEHPLLNKRICLIHMEDVDPIPPGTKGTVIGVNPVGLDMKWDNGRSLALIPEEDKFTILEEESTGKD